MYQLEGHMYIWKQTRICEITSSTILVMSIFSWLSNNENVSLRRTFSIYIIVNMSFTWTTQIRITPRNYYEFLHYMWFLGQNLILPIYGYMNVIYTSELLHHHLLGWVLNEDWEIILITSSSMVKYLHRCQEILMTRLEVYHSYNHNSQHYVEKIKGWHRD